MAKSTHNAKRPLFSWSNLIRIALSAAFAFWFYLIWNSVADLNKNMNIVSAQYASVHNVQVAFKTEIQEWKNVLLRSNNKTTLDKNKYTFEAQYKKVADEAQRIIDSNEIHVVKQRMSGFAKAHAENHELYQKSMQVFIESGYDAHKADATVTGIDRPLLDYLEEADVAMQDESKNINDRLLAKAKNQIDQSLLILSLMALLVIWMPKW